MAELNDKNKWQWNKMIGFCVCTIVFQFKILSMIK